MISRISPDLQSLARPIGWFRPDPENARHHGQRSIEAIKSSLVRFGQQKTIVVLDDGTVVAGNGTLEAVRSLGWDELAASILTDRDSARAYALADNRIPALSEWDPDALSSSVSHLDELLLSSIGFSPDELSSILDVDLFQSTSVAISTLRPHPRNYRTHPTDQINHIAKSIEEHGFYRNVVVARDGTILAGHGVVQASIKMGKRRVPVIRLDVAPDDPRALKVLAIDNEISHLAQVDDRALTEMLKEIMSSTVGLEGTGFDEQQLAALTFVTCLESEIKDKNEAAEWVGMPEFIPEEMPLKVIVAFGSYEDRAKFLSVIGSSVDPKIEKKVISIWYPEAKRRDVASVKFIEKEEDARVHPARVLDEPPKEVMRRFINECREMGCNGDEVERLAMATVKHLSDPESVPLAIEERWYSSLRAGSPDFGIYAGEEYLAELWGCWVTYSRKYLSAIQKSIRSGRFNFMSQVGPVSSVVDLGCGFGLSTAALTQVFPGTKVVGTNFRNTVQVRLARRKSEEFGFIVVDDPAAARRSIGGPVDLLFASEYFEHFEAPLDHLIEVLRSLEPRSIIVANTFTSPGVGHFNIYKIGESSVSGKEANRVFNQALTEAGYERIKTSLWNNRPAYWKKTT